ncbi:hypothetical protein pEaSNUABM37_00114 [Erwinia phage pEa_SNUABM_37]|nr:hypothetical protein pEaSNUABM37_00114 [Erwinia phage pEa_SNUABM_37]QXO10584.1 hypothetical protein pEaSNUABM48_00114 [Erwinia phage pEa_SNUABM_48]
MIESMLLGGKSSVPAGQVMYTAANTFSFVVPAGVNEISAYARGSGGGGGYGNTSYRGLAGGPGGIGGSSYANKIPVTPGETLTVRIGAGGGTPGPGAVTQLLRDDVVLLTATAGAAGYNSSGTGSSENNPGSPGPAAGAIPGATGLGTGNALPGSGGNGGKGYGFSGGYTASKGINGCMRIIWGSNRAFPSTNVADVVA